MAQQERPGAGASAQTTGGPGPFVTWVTRPLAEFERRDQTATHVLQTARRHRKSLAPLPVAGPRVHPHEATAAVQQDWGRVWAPQRISWWIAVLFMIGAAHFFIAAAGASLLDSGRPGPLSGRQIGWIYFIGSLFFTSAAYLQWLEALNKDLARGFAATTADHPARSEWRFWGLAPRSLGYWAAAVQLAGTLLFNVNTADGLLSSLDWRGENLLVWTPNMAGSVCFLVSSQLAVMEYSHHYWSFKPRSLAWWIVALNLLGSVFFQASALVSFVLPAGALVDAYHADLGTAAGALCFFTAAFLMIPELFEA